MSQALAFQSDPEGLVLRYLENPRPDLADLILVHYAGMVERLARRFAGIEPFEDLVQVGFIGMLNALSKFDPEAGVRFNTYATHLVAGEIKHYLRDRSQIIRLPAWMQELRAKVSKATIQLQAQLMRIPTPREVADSLSMTEAAILEVWQTQDLIKVGSLDQPMNEDDSSDGEMLDAAEYCPGQLSVEDRVVLEEAMTQLRDLERQVLVLFHFDSLNQTEIANRLGISCNYVSHILRQSLTKLRRILVNEDARDIKLRESEPTSAAGVIDPITGIYTQEFLFNRLAEEAHRASSEEGVVSALLIQFDGLDRLASIYGEASVNDFLADAADFLKENVRRLDIVCRHGNSGFGIVLPSTGPALNVVASRIHDLCNSFLSTRLAPVGTMQVSIQSAAFPVDILSVNEFVEFAKSNVTMVTFSNPESDSRQPAKRKAA